MKIIMKNGKVFNPVQEFLLKSDSLIYGMPCTAQYGSAPPPGGMDETGYNTKLHIVHSLSSGKVAATPILKSVPSQFSPFIL